MGRKFRPRRIFYLNLTEPKNYGRLLVCRSCLSETDIILIQNTKMYNKITAQDTYSDNFEGLSTGQSGDGGHQPHPWQKCTFKRNLIEVLGKLLLH